MSAISLVSVLSTDYGSSTVDFARVTDEKLHAIFSLFIRPDCLSDGLLGQRQTGFSIGLIT